MAAEIHDFLATTALGMEALLGQELERLGGQSVQAQKAAVFFRGPLEVGYRACMGSRIANRILLPLATFPAANPDQLYGGVRKIHWSDHLPGDGTLAVDFSTSHSKITHSYYGALKVKDAIVDQFRTLQGIRPSIDLKQPNVRVNVYLHKDQATVSIDLSGESLHKRGYRQEGTAAPLKENLAAAILKLAEWPRNSDVAFLDPMCGSGTLPIEAGLMAGNIAPGLGRTYFGFSGWLGHVPRLWKRVVEEAQSAVIRDKKQYPKIVGYDADFRAVRTALKNVEAAGLHGKVHIEKRELKDCDAIAPSGIFVVNPPYGERLGEVEALKPLYQEIGDLLKQKFKGWEGYVFTGSPELSKRIGLKASKRMVLFNGPIECRLFKFPLY